MHAQSTVTPNAQPSLASYHLGFCFIILSVLPIALGGPVLAALTCRLCGSDLIWRNCGRSIVKPTRKWGFLCSLAGAQAMYPSPAAPGNSSLGHLLPWSMCASHPKCFSPRRQFISSALEWGVTVPNYLAVQRFLVSHFPLTVLLWKYFLLWALSFVFLCGFYNRGSSVLALKQLQWELGFRQNTQMPLRRQAEKCWQFCKGTLCSVPAPQPPLLHLPFLLLASTTAAEWWESVPCPAPGSSLQQCCARDIWDFWAMSFIPHGAPLCHSP